MVARIRTGKSIARVLQYNEQKVRQQKAALLDAKNFVKGPSELNDLEKLAVFKKLMNLNERAATNTLHVSLNFDPSEKISKEKLKAIAHAYMEGIGFANQPYLVYRHDDAGHPHIHIVSTNIQWDGSRISMHNLGRTKSEVARKEIEQKFGLVAAQSGKRAVVNVNDRSGVAVYAKETTKQAINRVLSLCLGRYKPTTLDELKAIASLYQVGLIETTGTTIKGLSFVLTDALGKRISAPIKASALALRPTHKNLVVIFGRNERMKDKLKDGFCKRMELVLDSSKATTWNGLEKQLSRLGISLKVQQSSSGEMISSNLIDHRSGFIFQAEKLPAFTRWKDGLPSLPKGVADRLVIQQPMKENLSAANANVSFDSTLQTANIPPTDSGVPYPWKKPRKKKRKRINL